MTARTIAMPTNPRRHRRGVRYASGMVTNVFSIRSVFTRARLLCGGQPPSNAGNRRQCQAAWLNAPARVGPARGAASVSANLHSSPRSSTKPAPDEKPSPRLQVLLKKSTIARWPTPGVARLCLIMQGKSNCRAESVVFDLANMMLGVKLETEAGDEIKL